LDQRWAKAPDARILAAGRLAQLEERRPYKAEVRGSRPRAPTQKSRSEALSQSNRRTGSDLRGQYGDIPPRAAPLGGIAIGVNDERLLRPEDVADLLATPPSQHGSTPAPACTRRAAGPGTPRARRPSGSTGTCWRRMALSARWLRGRSSRPNQSHCVTRKARRRKLARGKGAVLPEVHI
jgi:hypothetical protein